MDGMSLKFICLRRQLSEYFWQYSVYAVQQMLSDCCRLTFKSVSKMVVFLLLSELDAGAVGLALSYSVTLMGMFQWGVRQSAEVENMVRYSLSLLFPELVSFLSILSFCYSHINLTNFQK